jgi:hypothetical protein
LQIKVNMTSFPETGNVEVWQREICALYRRYTGADPCQMDDAYIKEIGFQPYFYNTRSMWAASAPRIRCVSRFPPPPPPSSHNIRERRQMWRKLSNTN